MVKRRRAAHPAWTRRLFSDDDLEAIARAVGEAETRTSAEIRVHLERRVLRERWGRRPDALARAQTVFRQLGMDRTAERSGVLIYLALRDHALAIVGDEGIHRRVGDAYWASVRDRMLDGLRAGAAREAVLTGIAEIGRVLGEHFPRRPDDRNELSDRVSLG
jgi:uncharacterized membrane protein